MSDIYKYVSANEYVNSFAFEYFETYSFQRGYVYEEKIKTLKEEYDILHSKQLQQINLTEKESEQYSELYNLVCFTQYLLNDKQEFHFSSKKTNTFHHDTPESALVKKLLNSEVVNIPVFYVHQYIKTELFFMIDLEIPLPY